MRFRTALIISAFLAGGSLPAQTSGTGIQQKPVQHVPTTSAKPATEQAPAPAPVKVDPAKEAAIKHLMDITETSKVSDRMSDAISSQVRNVMGRSLPQDRLEKFMVAFDQKLRARVPESEVVDAMTPVYAEHFSMEDIQGLIHFYESPLGQRIVKELPQVNSESQNAGLKLEEAAALKTLTEMSSDYPELKPMLPGGSNDAPPSPGGKPAPVPAPTTPHSEPHQ